MKNIKNHTNVAKILSDAEYLKPTNFIIYNIRYGYLTYMYLQHF